VLVAGGGIVGMATAMALLGAFPGLGVIVAEKEPTLGRHQTGRNSGVIHSGIYYRPGSLKARLCREGGGRLREFCRDAGIRYEDCGKVIVAATPSEVPELHRLEERGRANGVPGVRVVGPGELAELEPSAAGIRALHVPATGIVDYREVLGAMADRVRAAGGRVMTNAEVLGTRRGSGGSTVATSAGEARVRLVVNCAGLYADRVARLAGARPNMRIVPFRGEYFTLRPAAGREIRGLIYPVPDPALPFLGAHVTRGIHGDVHVGPNAVLAFAREGYRRSTIRPGELWDTLRSRGSGCWPGGSGGPRSGSTRGRSAGTGSPARCRGWSPASRPRTSVRPRPGSGPRPWAATAGWWRTSGSPGRRVPSTSSTPRRRRPRPRSSSASTSPSWRASRWPEFDSRLQS